LRMDDGGLSCQDVQGGRKWPEAGQNSGWGGVACCWPYEEEKKKRVASLFCV